MEEEIVVTVCCGECGAENEAYYSAYSNLVTFRCENCGHITSVSKRSLKLREENSDDLDALCNSILGKPVYEPSVPKKRKMNQKRTKMRKTPT